MTNTQLRLCPTEKEKNPHYLSNLVSIGENSFKMIEMKPARRCIHVGSAERGTKPALLDLLPKISRGGENLTSFNQDSDSPHFNISYRHT